LNVQETPGESGLVDQLANGFVTYLAVKEEGLAVTAVRSLLNLRKQLSSEEVREVRVTWVDSNQDPFAINS
jgi:hypothetical protein